VMRVLLLGGVFVLAVTAAACGGGDVEVGRQSTEDWAAGFCAIFDGYFSATEQQVAELELEEGPLGERLEDGLSLALGQVALLSVTAGALDELVPGEGQIDEFQSAVSESLRVDARRMQRFIDAPPVTTDALQELLRVGASMGGGAVGLMQSSEQLDDAAFFALVDDPACSRWS
jgi:hypothetical protein